MTPITGGFDVVIVTDVVLTPKVKSVEVLKVTLYEEFVISKGEAVPTAETSLTVTLVCHH